MKKSKSRFQNPHGGGYKRHVQVHKGKIEKVLKEMEKDLKQQIKYYEEE